LKTPQKLTYFGQSAFSAVLCGVKAPLLWKKEIQSSFSLTTCCNPISTIFGRTGGNYQSIFWDWQVTKINTLVYCIAMRIQKQMD
jgi:hypothetical protein